MTIETNPAPYTGSPIKSLAARRAEITEHTITERHVPRWNDPEIVVVYGPAPHRLVRKVTEAKTPEAEVDIHADLLVNACQAVYGIVDGKRYSLREGDANGEPTRFDADLAEALGLPDPLHSSAREVVRALFMTEGDVISEAAAVAAWSGYKREDADRTISGE